MDQLKTLRQTIIEIINKRTEVPFSHGNIEPMPIIDEVNDHYVLMLVGWDQRKRIHGSLIHIDIRDEKIWIQRDGTENGLYTELVESGVSPDQIVLAFRFVDEREIDTANV